MDAVHLSPDTLPLVRAVRNGLDEKSALLEPGEAALDGETLRERRRR
ncbi:MULTISPECIES: hypothetical protein [Microbacterium]|nr:MULTISPECIES: hypothetical protein [Microbacterium]MDQ1082434.1 hypothetical protein [Microbacterium sp. SORGH_AS_0344]MDQ1168795.1 hypothetical protein [Microbacterium proteolyticum]